MALFIFLMISIGHMRIRKETGASIFTLAVGALTVAVTLVGFFATTLKTSPTSLIAFAVLAVVADTIWRSVRSSRQARS